MKKLYSDFLVDNWKLIIVLPLLLTVFSLAIFRNAKPDADLSDDLRRKQIEVEFEKELKSLNLPPETEAIKFEIAGKKYSSIRLQTSYRTELSKTDFIRNVNEQLTRNGWIFHEKYSYSAYTDYKYCRGKFDATISEAKGIKLFAEKGNHFHLSFSLGLRSIKLYGGNPLPESCRQD